MIVTDPWGIYDLTTARPELADMSLAAKVAEACGGAA